MVQFIKTFEKACVKSLFHWFDSMETIYSAIIEVWIDDLISMEHNN